MRIRWLHLVSTALDTLHSYLRNLRRSIFDAESKLRMDLILQSMLARGFQRPGSRADYFLNNFPAAVHEEFKRKLLDLETSALASADPQRFLRAALLAYTEGWQVLEFIDDITWGRNREPDDVYIATTMRSLLGQRFDYARSPPYGYYTHALGAEALHKYLTIKYPDYPSSALRDAYINAIFQRVMWLAGVIGSLATVGITPTGERSILPDDVILDHWMSWMLDTQAWAMDYSFSKRHRAGEWHF